jgi:hypothetical protein
MAEQAKKHWLIRSILPEQNRKSTYCFYSLTAVVLLTAFGKMTGETTAYVIIALAGILVGGNSFEHHTKKGQPQAPKPPEGVAE